MHNKIKQTDHVYNISLRLIETVGILRSNPKTVISSEAGTFMEKYVTFKSSQLACLYLVL